MTLLIILGICSFVGFFLIFIFMMPRSSAQSTLLEQVSREGRNEAQRNDPVVSAVNLDLMAKPFTLFRSFFSSEPDPDLVRRLLLAGYRKPAHADLFWGHAWRCRRCWDFWSRSLVPSNTIFIFLLTIVLAFFIPDFWLNLAVKKRRENYV